MEDVRNLLLNAISPLNLYLQGSRSGGQFESEFCTYWVDDIPEEFRDNRPVNAIWEIEFNYYSNQKNYEEKFQELIIKLRNAGFKTVGRGGDALTDDKNYKGRSINLTYKEKY